MYKLITCDMDETLLNEKRQIGAKTVAAIKAAVAKGVYFVPNTGRSFHSIQDNLETLGLLQKADSYVISYNGGVVVENQGLKIKLTAGMDFSVAKALLELGLSQGYCVHVYTVNDLYIWNQTQTDIDYLTGRVDDWTQMLADDKMDFLTSETITKVIVEILTEEERVAFRDLAESKFTDLNITFSSDRYVEFNSTTADKGQATLKLAQSLGIKPEEIIAIGDNGNDLSMIRIAGLGVCMANGRDFVKAEAQYVTINDYNHNGVAEVIEKFVLNDERGD